MSAHSLVPNPEMVLSARVISVENVAASDASPPYSPIACAINMGESLHEPARLNGLKFE